MKQLKISLKDKDYTETYLSALNGLLNLTDQELAVLAEFIRYDSQVAATTGSREHVVSALGMKNVAVLNNYIKRLKDKGCLVLNDAGNYVYNSLIRPENYIDGIFIKFEYGENQARPEPQVN